MRPSRYVLRGGQRRYLLFSLLYLAAVSAGALALYLLGAQRPFAIDASGGFSRTLRPETARAVAALTADVEITAFLAEGSAAARARALFDELSAASPRVFTRIIDPEADPQAVRDAKIGPGEQVLLRARGRESRISSAEELPIAQALARLTAERRRDICLSSGHGERDPRQEAPGGLSRAAALLTGEGFAVRSAPLSRLSALDGCRVVVVAGPARPLTEPQREALFRHVQRGGGLLLLAEADTPGGLSPLLARLGMELRLEALSIPEAQDPRAVAVAPLGEHPSTAALAATGRTVSLYGPAALFPRGGIPAQPIIVSGANAQARGGEPGAAPLGLALDLQPGRAVALGDVELFTNARIEDSGARELWLGMIGWLAEDLLNVAPPSAPLSPQARRLIALGAQLAFPGLFSLAALWVWRRRRP